MSAASIQPVAPLQLPADLGDAARESQARKVGQIAFWATALFLAQLYLAPAQWFPQTEPLHIALVLSLIGLAAIAVRRVLTNRPLWMGGPTPFLAVYAVAALLSPIWSIAPASSAQAGLEAGKNFLFFLAVVNAVTTPSRVRTAVFLFAAAAIVPGWGTFSNWWHGELLVQGFRGRWLGVMGDPNHDAMALVGALPLLLTFAASGPGRLRRVVGIAGTAAVLAGIIATHSRGGAVGLAVTVVIWALLSERKALASAIVCAAAAGVLLFSPASFWHRTESIASFAEDESVRGRMDAWQVAGRIFKERPVLGVGKSAFTTAWDPYAPIDAGPIHYVAHNLELEVLGELGLVGLFGMLGFLGAALVSAWRARRGELGKEARALFASLVGYIVCQQFSGYSHSWYLYGLAALAVCCGHWGRRPRGEVPARGAASS